MKKAELEKLKGKKVAGTASGPALGGGGTASNKREQALEQKRQLLERLRRPKKD